jgi:pyruvate,water dikinase
VVFIEAVLGLGEGLVSGELVADQYEVSRDGNFDVTLTLADKVEMMVQDKDGGGVIKVGVNPERVKERALTDDEARKIARLMINLELKMEKPQDFEWAIENGQLYCLQARPIVTLPPSCFFDHSATGSDIILWDNSNIVESYSGVTTPLTFSFVSNAYEKVYTLTLLAAGVPSSVVKDHKPYLANMLGLVRGNIYYNLLSWYRCLTCIPLGDTSKYMETMMGVKQSLDPKIDAEIGYIQSSAPRYSIWVKIKLLLAIMERIYFIDSYVNQFFEMFDRHYKEAIEMDFESLTLQEQIKYIKHLNESVLGNWSVPIYNDTYVMIFFGLLKKLVSKYLTDDIDKAQSLQNDLLCGQGDVESTEPTKMLMRIAEYVDTEVSTDVRGWFMDHKDEVVAMLTDEKERRSKFKASKVNKLENVLSSEGLRRRKNVPISETDSNSTTDPLMKEKLSIIESILKFLDKYGFRCINELKLEENTLHDDPTFVVEAICGYMLTQSYDIFKMEEREMSIRTQAESVVSSTISWPKRTLFNWVLFHARRGVRHRENMRFARTKLFGLFRNLFRAVGTNFVKLELLKERQVSQISHLSLIKPQILIRFTHQSRWGI